MLVLMLTAALTSELFQIRAKTRVGREKPGIGDEKVDQNMKAPGCYRLGFPHDALRQFLGGANDWSSIDSPSMIPGKQPPF